MKRIKYPHLLILAISLFIAYIIFKGKDFTNLAVFISDFGYIATFVIGFLFSYGFTALPAASVLLILGPTQNILLATTIATIGSTIGDLAMVKIFSLTFKKELDSLSKEKPIKKTREIFPKKIRHYLAPIIAGFALASPLPDEFAVSFYTETKHLPKWLFALTSFILHFIGIYIILKIGSTI